MSLTKRFLELTSSDYNLTTDEYIDQYHNNYYEQMAMEQQYQEWLNKQAEQLFFEKEYNDYIELTAEEWKMLNDL